MMTCLLRMFHGAMFRNISKSSMKKKVQLSTVFHQRQNGNTQPALAPKHDTRSEMRNQDLEGMHGMLITQVTRRIQSVRRNPIPGDCTTCTAMSGNGCRIGGIITMMEHPQMVVLG